MYICNERQVMQNTAIDSFTVCSTFLIPVGLLYILYIKPTSPESDYSQLLEWLPIGTKLVSIKALYLPHMNGQLQFVKLFL